MAIRLITGVPGAGKSFYAVKHLRDNCYTYDKNRGFYEYKSCVVVSTKFVPACAFMYSAP